MGHARDGLATGERLAMSAAARQGVKLGELGSCCYPLSAYCCNRNRLQYHTTSVRGLPAGLPNGTHDLAEKQLQFSETFETEY